MNSFSQEPRKLLKVYAAVRVTQLVAFLSTESDEDYLPAGDKGKGSAHVYNVLAWYRPSRPADEVNEAGETEAVEKLMQEFRDNTQIAGPEDFSVELLRETLVVSELV